MMSSLCPRSAEPFLGLEDDQQVQQYRAFLGDGEGQALAEAGVLREVYWHSSGPPQFARYCHLFQQFKSLEQQKQRIGTHL